MSYKLKGLGAKEPTGAVYSKRSLQELFEQFALLEPISFYKFIYLIYLIRLFR